MAATPFNEELKTRVTESQKRELQRLASLRELDLSDIVREALREYLARRARKGKAVAA